MKHKLLFDAALLVLFAVMCNTNATGTLFHEVLGLAYIALLAVHIIINRKWAAALFAGKLCGAKSRVGAAVNGLLFADFALILATGIRASHYLFRFTEKAPNWVIMAHVVCGIIAAGFVLAHVLLHLRVIAKGRNTVGAAVCVTLAVTIGYSVFGGVQGALHHGLPKGDVQIENGENEHKPKDGERK